MLPDALFVTPNSLLTVRFSASGSDADCAYMHSFLKNELVMSGGKLPNIVGTFANDIRQWTLDVGTFWGNFENARKFEM
jgi:hypothetical protein